MANNIINGVTTENTPKFTNEDIEKIREKLKKNNSNNLDENGKINEDCNLQIITLKDCIDIINGFIEGKVSADELEEFGNRMTIRSYIPLLEKMSLLMQVLTKHEISATESTEIKMAELYKDIFFTIVMSAYGLVQINVLNDEDRALMTYENYDKLFPIFYSYILSYCKQDYDVFMQMFNDCISWNGVVNITESISNIDSDKLSEAVESNKKLVESMNDNKEMVSDIKDILLATDKTVKDVVKGIKGATVREVIEQGKKNLEEKNRNGINGNNGNNVNNVVSIDELKKKQEESKQEVVVDTSNKESNKEDVEYKEGSKPTPKKRGRPPKKKE